MKNYNRTISFDIKWAAPYSDEESLIIKEKLIDLFNHVSFNIQKDFIKYVKLNHPKEWNNHLIK